MLRRSSVTSVSGCSMKNTVTSGGAWLAGIRQLVAGVRVANARQTARLSAQGQRQLPEHITRKARRAAEFISQFDPQDRIWVIRIVEKRWWRNGASSTLRWKGSARSIYNKAVEFSDAGVPDNLITVEPVPGNKRLFRLYVDRESP